MHVLTGAVIATDHFPLMLSFQPPDVLSSNVPLIPKPPSPAQPISDEELEQKYDDNHNDPSSSSTTPEPTPEPSLVVKPSTIPGGGMGLFANQNYKPGELIIKYTGEAIDEKQKQTRYPRNDAHYVMYVKQNVYIDAADPSLSSDARYINTGGKLHNNATLKISHHNGEHHANVRASSHIMKGDEIFMPYGRTFRHFTFIQPPPKQRRSRANKQTQQRQQPHVYAHAHVPPHRSDASSKSNRVRWKITNDMDWRLFESHVSPQLKQWTDKYDEWSGNNTPTTLTQKQIDTCWHEWLDIITNTAKTCIGTVTTPPNSKEWWQFIPNIHTLHETYRKARRDSRAARRRGRVPPPSHVLASTRERYLRARGAFLKAIQKGKQKYDDEMVSAIDHHTPNNKHKPYWARLKRVMPRSHKAQASFPDRDGAPPQSPQQSLNNLAEHLARVSSLAHEPSHDADHERHVKEYLANHVLPHSNVREPPSFSLDDVSQACSRFRLNTALGSDNVSPYFLKRGGDVVHKSLYMLFSILSRHGMVPSSFRHGHVVTLYKGEGEVSNPNNYRPITITSVVARLYERVHVKSLLAAMLRANMPSPEQFGFTAKRSCHDAIYRLLSLIVETIDQGSGDSRFVPAVFVDISKAYDKVWIEGLLYKLHKMGVTGNLYYMLRSLLTNRTIQVVSADGTISLQHILSAGVPQGSILAPFLFLIYIHDILSNVPPSVCLSIFADDIALLPLIPGADGLAPMQRALSVMTRYASLWKITFSSKKTNTVYFRPDIRGKWKEPSLKLKLGNFNITTATQYTYLGVMLDNLLTFIPHACYVIHQVTRTAHLISRLVRRDSYPSFPVIQTLVKCILVPQLTYGFPFFSVKDEVISTKQATGNNSTKGNLYRRMKNAILRPLLFSLGLPHHTNHASVFIESRLLDVNSLFTLCSAQLVHRWLSMEDNTTNAATLLFRQHLASAVAPRSPFHPYNVLCSAIRRVGGLQFDPADIAAFQDIKRNKLRGITWNQQYTSWYDSKSKDGLQPSLISCYPRRPQEGKHNKLPLYLHYDHPSTASHRARLRFGRALLCSFMHRFKFKGILSPKCTYCQTDSDETVSHTVSSCNYYMMERLKCIRELDVILPATCSSQWPLTKFDLSGGPAIAPELYIIDSKSKKKLHKVLYITGKFIDSIQRERKF